MTLPARLLTMFELHQATGVSIPAIRRMIQYKKIRTVRFSSRTVRFLPETIDEVKAAASQPKSKSMRVPLSAIPDCAVPGGCPAPLCNDPKNRIYFIRSGDFIKIGFSKNTDYRMMHLQIANPHPLELVIEIEGDKMIENYLHLILKREHHRGEWFHLNETVALFIQSLKDGADIDQARALCALFPEEAGSTDHN